MIAFLSFVFLVDGEYFIKNLLAKSFYVKIKSGSKEFNHAIALSLRENENGLNLNSSYDTLAILKASLTSKNSLK